MDPKAPLRRVEHTRNEFSPSTPMPVLATTFFFNALDIVQNVFDMYAHLLSLLSCWRETLFCC